MDILDLFGAEDEPETYMVMGLEYSRENHPCRCTSPGGGSRTSIEDAEAVARDNYTVISDFKEPDEDMTLTDLGNLAYKHRWSVVVVYRQETGLVVRMADLPR